MPFDPDVAPGYPARVLRAVKVPPTQPAAPMGRFSTRDLARAALLSALIREGDWWGLPMLTRWATARALTPLQAQGLALELVAQGRVVEGHTSPGCPRWRARGGA